MFERSEKKVVQDIVPSSRRTIRNVSFTEDEPIRPKAKIPRARKEIPYEDDEEETKIPLHIKSQARRSSVQSFPENPRRRKFSAIIVTFVVVFLGLAVIAVAISLFYSKAVVTVTPKVAPIEVNGTFTAKKTAGVGELAYEVVTAKLSETGSVPATDGPFVQTKAKGTAYLYNEQMTAQKIVAGTRLSNPEGLVYRTSVTVTIPAAKKVSGKITPGSITAVIIADQAGENYNMLISDLKGDLKVVAYKGSDKYNTVYGRIKTDITGGFLGNKKVISPESKKTVTDKLQTSLKAKLISELSAKNSKEAILLKDAITFEYETKDMAGTVAGSAQIVVTATAYGITFNPDKLLKFIGEEELRSFPVQNYETRGIENLVFSIVNTKDFSAKKGTSLIFNLKGSLTLIGIIPENSIKNELKDVSLEKSNEIFAKYPAIASAHALITPFWMRSFPSSPEKIIIEVKSE